MAFAGLYQPKLNRPHKHFDVYEDGSMYVFEHQHGEVFPPKNRYPVTPWVMFFIFAMGPSQPMIPLLSYPAARQSLLGITALILVYVFFTVATMAVTVVLSLYGTAFFKAGKVERYIHASGSLTILICGAEMFFFRLVVESVFANFICFIDTNSSFVDTNVKCSIV